jgi:PAS domain S-box-containing protein
LFGYKSGEVETTYDNFLAAIHPDDRESVVNAVNNSVGNGAKYDIEHRVVWPDGEVRWLYESGDVMRDEDGKAQRMLGLVQDITTRKAFEDEMQKAKEKAEIAANAKAVFLANMSHEIRTPMNAVIGFTDLALKSPELTGTLKTHVGKANVSAKGLLSVINEILDFSKLDADKLELEEVCFNLPRAMRETVQMFGLQAEQKGINLEFEYSDKLRKCFRGDLTRLRQVVVNLIGNAVKFTDKGSVVLSVEKGEETVHFKIIDTGIGMSPKQAERVFESFTQADGSTARRFGGTGLGTTISKQIVELMGGKIWIESKEGAGSTFNFTIPLPSTDCSKDCIFQEQIEKEIDWSPRLFRILLAEDNVLNSELVEINLVDEQGHEVIWVMDGQAAVERFKEGGIDIILMDYQMPVLDGISATREIRKLEGSTGGHMPIVALTASATMDEQAYFKESGMDVFVKKPINFSELIATMESVVPAGVGTLNTGVPVKSEGTSYISLDPIATVVDINAGLKIWKSQEKYANALAKFARERKDDPAELERLIDAGKINDAKRIAHTLKGLSLGLTDISKSAAEVDAKLKAKDKDAALALLPDLAGVFSIALDAINKIKLPEREVLPKKEFDAKEVGLLFRSLFEGLEEDNPDAVTPVLEGLALYVDDIELNGIKDSVEDFDFPVARIKAIKFAEKLGVN